MQKSQYCSAPAFAGKRRGYNLENDPVEMTDRSETDSLKRNQLTEQYQTWSKEYGVLPWPLN